MVKAPLTMPFDSSELFLSDILAVFRVKSDGKTHVLEQNSDAHV